MSFAQASAQSCGFVLRKKPCSTTSLSTQKQSHSNMSLFVTSFQETCLINVNKCPMNLCPRSIIKGYQRPSDHVRLYAHTTKHFVLILCSLCPPCSLCVHANFVHYIRSLELHSKAARKADKTHYCSESIPTEGTN